MGRAVRGGDWLTKPFPLRLMLRRMETKAVEKKKGFGASQTLDSLPSSFGRSERIRTFDPLIPNQMRYQAALRSDEPSILSGFRTERQIQDRAGVRRTRKRGVPDAEGKNRDRLPGAWTRYIVPISNSTITTTSTTPMMPVGW